MENFEKIKGILHGETYGRVIRVTALMILVSDDLLINLISPHPDPFVVKQFSLNELSLYMTDNNNKIYHIE